MGNKKGAINSSESAMTDDQDLHVGSGPAFFTPKLECVSKDASDSYLHNSV